MGKRDVSLWTVGEREALTPFPVIDLLSKQVDASTQDVTGREEDDNTQCVEGGEHRVHPASGLRVAPQDTAGTRRQNDQDRRRLRFSGTLGYSR